jgi:hypothetical protein
MDRPGAAEQQSRRELLTASSRAAEGRGALSADQQRSGASRRGRETPTARGLECGVECGSRSERVVARPRALFSEVGGARRSKQVSPSESRCRAREHAERSVPGRPQSISNLEQPPSRSRCVCLVRVLRGAAVLRGSVCILSALADPPLVPLSRAAQPQSKMGRPDAKPKAAEAPKAAAPAAAAAPAKGKGKK